MDARVGLWRKLSAKELMNCGAGEDSWESLDCEEIKPVTPKGNQPWNWSSNTLATWFEEPADWKRPWCWERSMAGRVRGDRGEGGWFDAITNSMHMSLSKLSGRQWRTGKPGVLQSMGSQSQTQHRDWTTKTRERCFSSTHLRCDGWSLTDKREINKRKTNRS